MDIHVVPREGQWVVEQTGGGELGNFPTQEAAITAGRQKAQQDRAELFIHDEKGKIRDRSSFGNDPRGGG